MLVIWRFFSERKFVFVYLAIWFAVIWAVLAISLQVNVPSFISYTLYLSAFAVIHLGVIGQLYLHSKGEPPSIKNGFQLAQKHFLDWGLVVFFAILYSLIISLPLVLVFVIASVAGLGILVIFSVGFAYLLFVLLTVSLYEVGMRAVIFHSLPSNYAVKYAFKLVRENLGASLKSLLKYFFVGFVTMLFIALLFMLGFLPYMSNPDLTVALRLYAENQFLGFVLSIMMFFVLSIGIIFSTSLLNAFFVPITEKRISLEHIE